MIDEPVVTLRSPPTYNFLAIPTPPANVRAPVVEDVDSVTSDNVATPVTPRVVTADKAPDANIAVPSVIDEPVATSRSPPTYISLAIPAPPATVNAATVVDEASVVSWISNLSVI